MGPVKIYAQHGKFLGWIPIWSMPAVTLLSEIALTYLSTGQISLPLKLACTLATTKITSITGQKIVNHFVFNTLLVHCLQSKRKSAFSTHSWSSIWHIK